MNLKRFITGQNCKVINGKLFTFIGQTLDNKKHGFGIQITNSNGDLYIGQFNRDKRQGFGIFKQHNYKAYISNFIQNKPGKLKHYGTLNIKDLTFTPDYKKFIALASENGKQVMCNVKEQIILKGMFIDQELVDLGEKIDKKNNIVYTGKFQNSQLIEGTIEYRNTGVKIIGTFDEFGRLQEQCQITYQIGEQTASLVALFHNDKIVTQQQVNIKFIDGSEFKGYIENDYFKRQGQLITDLFTYMGNFDYNNFNGYGKIIFKNKDQYEGEFVDSKFYGKGKYIFADGGSITGQFNGNQLNGRCQIIDKDGNIYNGSFLQNKPFGEIKIQYIDGSQYSGYVDSLLRRSGNGELVLPDKKFQGKFLENTLSGTILITHSNNFQEHIKYKRNEQVPNQVFVQSTDTENDIIEKVLLNYFKKATQAQVTNGNIDMNFQFTGKAKIIFSDEVSLDGVFQQNKLQKQFILNLPKHQLLFILDKDGIPVQLEEIVIKSSNHFQSYKYQGGIEINKGKIMRTGLCQYSTDEMLFNGKINQNQFQSGKLQILKVPESKTFVFPYQFQGNFVNNKPHEGTFYLANNERIECTLENNQYKGKLFFYSGNDQLNGIYKNGVPQSNLSILCQTKFANIQYYGQALDIIQDVAARIEIIVNNKKFTYKGSIQNGGKEGIGKVNGFIAIIKDKQIIITDSAAEYGLKGEEVQQEDELEEIYEEIYEEVYESV